MAARRRTAFDAEEARLAVMRHWRGLSHGAQINMTEYTAQQFEQDAVELIAGFMYDTSLPFTFRRDCARDVITYARGEQKVWLHDGLTVDPTLPGKTGHPIADEIKAIQATTELHKQLSDLMMRGVHPIDWPKEVREVAGDLIGYYDEQDKIIQANE
jgi:hypothetical protein